MHPDHLSKALEALRERPQPQVGLASNDEFPRLGYVAGIEPNDGLARPRRKNPAKSRMAAHLSASLCERARNAVWHLSDTIRLNLSSLIEGPLEREVTRLEQEFNGGKPFPQRKGRLKGGPLRAEGVRHEA